MKVEYRIYGRGWDADDWREAKIFGITRPVYAGKNRLTFSVIIEGAVYDFALLLVEAVSQATFNAINPDPTYFTTEKAYPDGNLITFRIRHYILMAFLEAEGLLKELDTT